MSDDTMPDDYRPLLETLSESGLPYFIEGCQAVNVWAEFFFSEEMEEFVPFTSRDSDIWVYDPSHLRERSFREHPLRRSGDRDSGFLPLWLIDAYNSVQDNLYAAIFRMG